MRYCVVVRDYEGLVVSASCCHVFSLLDSEIAEVLATQKELEFAKDVSFLNLIVESDASKAVQALNPHQQYSNYV